MKLASHCLFVISLIALTGCAGSNRQLFVGENLIIPYAEELKDWQLFQKEEGSYRANMWQKRGERWADTYAVSINYNEKAMLEIKRQVMDAPGKESCESFNSKDLVHPKQMPFEYMYWETSCKNGGKDSAKIIHLMIQGNDSFYHIQKAWRAGFTDEDVTLWRSRFDDTFVCDSRQQPNDCPKVE